MIFHSAGDTGLFEKQSTPNIIIKINSVISLTLCGLLHSILTPDMPAKSSNCHEIMSSIHSSVEAKEHSPGYSPNSPKCFLFHFPYEKQSLKFLSFLLV